MAAPLIACSGLAKRYGGIVAIKNADIDLFPGEVHALLGRTAQESPPS